MNFYKIAGLVYGNIDKVDDYIKNGFDLNTTDRYNWNLLHYACRAVNFNSVKFLIERNIDINLTDIHGRTPLYISCDNRLYEAIDLLLSHNANPKIGECCVDIVIEKKDLSCLSIFLKHESLFSEKQKEKLRPYKLKLQLKSEPC